MLHPGRLTRFFLEALAVFAALSAFFVFLAWPEKAKPANRSNQTRFAMMVCRLSEKGLNETIYAVSGRVRLDLSFSTGWQSWLLIGNKVYFRRDPMPEGCDWFELGAYELPVSGFSLGFRNRTSPYYGQHIQEMIDNITKKFNCTQVPLDPEVFALGNVCSR